jgi:lipoprotein-anchoring transpeptidase ErfK/SrfK
MVLPVIAQQPGWYQVRLPQRPNGSTAWVQDSDVTLSSTPYHIVVNLTLEHVIVYQDGAPVLEFPAGIGLPVTPTPTGNYFVAVHEAQPQPGYGPVILDTSAHSEAIKSWEGQGDAIIAIHGPITSGADARIGSTGTRVSNGCIRLHNQDLAQLATIPPGTPVDIIGTAP